MDKLREFAILTVFLAFIHFSFNPFVCRSQVNATSSLMSHTSITCEKDHCVVIGDMLIWNLNALARSCNTTHTQLNKIAIQEPSDKEK